MTEYSAEDLIGTLELESLEHNIYRGRNRDIGTRHIYGGQVLAQSVVAASRTVDDDRPVHSMHGYFILPGDLEAPVVYFVDRLRDGGSFTTRRVTGIQHGRAIFTMSASFHRTEEGPEHQTNMPDVPGPDGLPSELDLIRRMEDRIPEGARSVLTQDRPLDIRPVDPVDPFEPEVRDPIRHIWVRALGDVRSALHHRAILAYASDYGLLGAALQPHGITWRRDDVMVASLDHAIWYHRDPDVNDWLLFTMESPTAGGARGFSRGTFFTREGTLVASVAQEGLVRMLDDD
ncbi:MAG: acyl-CoA thioesterase [Candidatus Longimicrobiales bacterium M2_2A_002]